MHGYKKKLVWPTSKADIEVGYQLLGTNLGDGILCTVLSNYNIHRCLSVMDNVCFKAIKCVGMHFHANSKKTQSVGKNDCIQKCLDKSLLVSVNEKILFYTNFPSIVKQMKKQ